ncbi:hypothetical protein [Candidatus Oscillochloris fontis]|uniref:hypothetical protein n=1 Tax=Candidatus Oscillochloris fontis TaxID=2496868 RepID=UPI00101E1BCE|nr:hypothetical protein [Candidatus Oscillochloris fontis]
MNRNWNWQGWLAIAISCLALLISLNDFISWRGVRQMVENTTNQMVIERSDQHPGRGNTKEKHDQNDDAQMMPGRGNPHAMPRAHEGWGLFGMIAGLVGMLLDLAKLAGLGLLAWLLWRLFTQRQAAPLTPAGHDPRVE